MLTLNAPYATFITGTLIPLLTGLLTHYNLSSKIKLIITGALNLVAAILTSAIVTDTSYIISGHTLVNAVMGFITSEAWYYGVFRKNGLTSSLPEGKLFPDKGLGSE